MWELYVHAGRDPALQAIARRWSDGCLRILADTLRLPPDDPPPAPALHHRLRPLARAPRRTPPPRRSPHPAHPRHRARHDGVPVRNVS
ncbi:hypothetical protein [Nonomuraea salmonea]|uniref:hypothetical protein n=1 Tax=Nonomuraea salmonea TaxID=46181 RepID=UPI003CD0B30C